jgi:hypothetical protein
MVSVAARRGLSVKNRTEDWVKEMANSQSSVLFMAVDPNPEKFLPR